MTANDWIRKYEEHLLMVKNRALNTVVSYVNDLKHLNKTSMAGPTEDWSAFTEQMAVDYVKSLKAWSRDTTIARKVYCFRGFFKFLRRQGVVTSDPFADMEFHSLHRPLPKFLTVDEMNRLLN